MPRIHPVVERKKIEFQTAECRLTFASTVVGRSGGLYLKLPNSQADYYSIGPGDTVLVSIHELRRAKQDEG